MPTTNGRRSSVRTSSATFWPSIRASWEGADERRGLLDQLNMSRIVSLVPAPAAAPQNPIRFVAEIAVDPGTGYRKGQRFTYVVDTERNHLPTRIASLYDDGSLHYLDEIAYQEVVPGKAWFVREWSRKVFMPEVRAQDPTAQGWHQMVLLRTIGDLQVNMHLPDDAFHVEMPPGTRVTDQVHSSTYHVGLEPERDSESLLHIGDQVPRS